MRSLHLQRYLLTGLLTIIPLWVTWLVFSFILQFLASLGAPVIEALLATVSRLAPTLFHSLNPAWLNPLLALLALLFTLVSLYVIGWFAQRVIGKRLLATFDRLISKIPLVRTIYDGTKKLTTVMQQKPSGIQRVVLIDFPMRGMKAVGFVTRVLREQGSNREMAAVYVPTTPNPTSGYLEVVPVDELVPTDWTMDQAMAFIISGGAVAPETLPTLQKAASTTQPSDTTHASTAGTHHPARDSTP